MKISNTTKQLPVEAEGDGLNFSKGQVIVLTNEVYDDETGLCFPAGSIGEISLLLDSVTHVECKFDTSIADPLDTGNYAYPIIKYTDFVERAQET